MLIIPQSSLPGTFIYPLDIAGNFLYYKIIFRYPADLRFKRASLYQRICLSSGSVTFGVFSGNEILEGHFVNNKELTQFSSGFHDMGAGWR